LIMMKARDIERKADEKLRMLSDLWGMLKRAPY
jgi:hypothetical protein